jgi:hypothetical protein
VAPLSGTTTIIRLSFNRKEAELKRRKISKCSCPVNSKQGTPQNTNFTKFRFLNDSDKVV